MAEIRIAPKQSGITLYTWVLALVLLVVIVLGALSVERRQTAAAPALHPAGAAATDNDAQWDGVPPQLRQYA